ncbi:MAG: twin-arginine translocase subunit TatC [Chloroflexota bacterium]
MRKVFTSIWSTITAPIWFLGRLFRTLLQWLKNTFRNITLFFTQEPVDSDFSEVISKTITNPSEVLTHLYALRKHLLRGFIALILTTTLSFLYTPKFINYLAQPIGGIEHLQAIEVTEPISVYMRVALLVGFTIALPYIALELLLFAAPGLKRKARILGLVAIPVALVFFVGGMAFAYYVMLPAALPFLLSILNISVALRPSSFFRFVTSLLFWVGISFEFPLVIYVLAAMKVIKAKSLASNWRLAVVIMAILAAAITPTIDPINMLLVLGPMILLYFMSIGLAYLAQEKPVKEPIK